MLQALSSSKSYHDINASELLEGSVEGLVDRAGTCQTQNSTAIDRCNIPLIGHIEIHSQEVVLVRAIELQLGRIASSRNDFVAFGECLLDEFGAETRAGAGDEEDLLRHCVCLSDYSCIVIVRD